MNKLLKFSKENCVPCTLVANYLDENEVETHDFDVNESPELAGEYGIMSVPALILVDENDNFIDSSVGFNPEKINDLISKL